MSTFELWQGDEPGDGPEGAFPPVAAWLLLPADHPHRHALTLHYRRVGALKAESFADAREAVAAALQELGGLAW